MTRQGARIGVAAALMVVGAGALPAAATTPRTKTVKLGEYFYTPKTVQIRPGDRVRFVNVGKLPHTVKGGPIKPRQLDRGDTQTVRFRKAGTFRYVCTLHPTRMSGTVRVKR